MDPERNEKRREPHSGSKKRPFSASGLEAFALVSQLGLTIALPVVLGAAAGRWIDGKLGTGMFFFLILLILGLIGGFAGAYRLIMAVGKRDKD